MLFRIFRVIEESGVGGLLVFIFADERDIDRDFPFGLQFMVSRGGFMRFSFCAAVLQADSDAQGRCF